MSGRASDIPGMSEHLHGGGDDGGGGTGRARGQRAILSHAAGDHLARVAVTPGGSHYSGGMTGLASQRGVGRWGLQPFFNNELASLIAEGEASGHHIGVTEGFRSYAAQVAAARNKPGLAARPGHSRHGLGLAADLHGDLAWAHIHAAAHGLHFPMWPGRPGGKHEPWHIEPMGGRQHQSYAPPPRSNTTVVVHSRVNLDGRVLASGVERHIVKRHQFAHGPADHDGRQGMPHVDLASNMG